jgi:hypothetical protein
MSSIERNSYCLTCPDIEQYVNRESVTGYRCKARGGKYLNLKRQKKTVLRDCPRRKAKYGKPEGTCFECIWCGKRTSKERGVQIKGETRRYCSTKCLGEYLWTRQYDHNGNVVKRRPT